MDEDSFYAPAYRVPLDALHAVASFVEGSPVVSTILRSTGGLCVVLNKQRQILGASDEFRDGSGVESRDGLVGMRLGEALRCMHSCKDPSGCGTTPWCCTCGATIAMMAAQARDEPVVRKCVIQVEDDGGVAERIYHARCMPIRGDGPELYLLHLHELPRDRFVSGGDPFWDRLQELMGGIVLLSDHLASRSPFDPVSRLLGEMVGELGLETNAQMILLRGLSGAMSPMSETFPVHDLLEALKLDAERSPHFIGRRIEISEEPRRLVMRGNRQLLRIVLREMLANALEASHEGEEVRIGAGTSGDSITLSVWNRDAILPHFALRVFEKHFTTREGQGRGWGTWLMKHLGEDALGGRVGFSSSEADGTRFHVTLPLERGGERSR